MGGLRVVWGFNAGPDVGFFLYCVAPVVEQKSGVKKADGWAAEKDGEFKAKILLAPLHLKT